MGYILTEEITAENVGRMREHVELFKLRLIRMAEDRIYLDSYVEDFLGSPTKVHSRLQEYTNLESLIKVIQEKISEYDPTEPEHPHECQNCLNTYITPQNQTLCQVTHSNTQRSMIEEFQNYYTWKVALEEQDFPDDETYEKYLFNQKSLLHWYNKIKDFEEKYTAHLPDDDVKIFTIEDVKRGLKVSN